MWTCGEPFEVVSDAVVRTNLILNSLRPGITATPHAQVSQVRNVTIVNNTIYGHPECLFIRWSGASNMILANNAVYCPGKIAVNASGLTDGTITVRSNYIDGDLAGATIDGRQFFPGGSASLVFTNPLQFDFWPRLKAV